MDLMDFPLNTGAYESVICVKNTSEINLKKKVAIVVMQQWWSTAMYGSLLPLDHNFQDFLSLHSIPEYPIINTSNGVNRKSQYKYQNIYFDIYIKISIYQYIKKTFILWGLWGQGGDVLLLVQVFPDG